MGTRANYIKLSPVFREARSFSNIEQEVLSASTFSGSKVPQEELDLLGIEEPVQLVSVGNNGFFDGISTMSEAFYDQLAESDPNFVFVYGDVESTYAGALAAVRANKTLVHLEAGLRNENWNDPEEISRITVDHLAEYLAPPDEFARKNLKNEGVNVSSLLSSGNLMIDTLDDFLTGALRPASDLDISFKEYGLFTLHRIQNLQSKERMESILSALEELSKNHVFLCFLPRKTLKCIDEYELTVKLDSDNIFIYGPKQYGEFIQYLSNASFVLTDSSSLQDETTFMDTPCFTCLSCTHRKVTIEHGTNVLVGADRNTIVDRVRNYKFDEMESTELPSGWDGDAANRIINNINNIFNLTG